MKKTANGTEVTTLALVVGGVLPAVGAPLPLKGDHQMPSAAIVSVLIQVDALPRAQRQAAMLHGDCEAGPHQRALHMGCTAWMGGERRRGCLWEGCCPSHTKSQLFAGSTGSNDRASSMPHVPEAGWRPLTRHVIRPLVAVAVAGALRRDAVECICQVQGNIGAGVLIDGQAGRGVLNEEVAEPDLHLLQLR